MKNLLKGLILIWALAALAACVGTRPMEVTYNVRTATALKDYTVYLVVNDRRDTDNLVGAEAMSRNLFPELRGGRFDLRVNLPGGNRVIITNLSTVEAVREAVGRRLQSQNVTVTAQRSAAHLTMEINIDEMNIDLADGDLVATVALSSATYRDASATAKSNTRVTSNRMKLIGGAGGATVLSEALSQALNDLDLSGVNRF